MRGVWKNKAVGSWVVPLFLLFFTGANAATSFPEPPPLDGIAGYVEGRALGVIRELLRMEAPGWAADAFAAALALRQRDAGTSGGLPIGVLADAGLRSDVCAALRQKFETWLPEAAKGIVADDVLGGAAEKAARDEAAAIADRASQALGKKIGALAEKAAAKLYDTAVEKLRRAALEKTGGIVDVTRLRESIDRAFDLETVGDVVQTEAARLVGDATAAGIRSRIEDALGGRLPPEAIAALERGPQEFEKYAAKLEGVLPGSRLRQLSDSILNRPIVKLPSAAYGAILAASAAIHYANAFKGVTVDLYELKRGGEVTRVMLWQLSNKQWINLTLLQLGGIARGLAGRIGAGAAFDVALEKLREPLDRIQGLADQIDRFVMKPVERTQDGLRKIVDTVRGDLEAFQKKLVDPINVGLDNIQAKFDRARDAVADLLPKKFDGIPQTWEELKAKLGPTAEIADAEKIPAKNASLSKELDPVLLHNGEFLHRVTDLVIPGRGIDLRFTRIYRGRSDFLGEFGWRWTHSYAERLLPRDGGFTYVDAEGLKHSFERDGDRFASPKGLYARLVALGAGGFEIRWRDGFITVFDAEGKLLSRRDRFGNQLTFLYDRRGLLASVVDVFGRTVAIERRKDGLIRRIRDFSGRAFAYEYNEAQELIGVTVPATPDFPKGKTTAYRYVRPDSAVHAMHLISLIVDPNGRTSLRNRYDAEGRVIAQSYGGGSARHASQQGDRDGLAGDAGGSWMTVQYEDKEQGVGGEDKVRSRTWVTDAKGITRLSEHDGDGHLLRRWRWDEDGYHLLEQHLYNDEGERTAECLPSGRCRYFIFWDGDRQGELLRIEERLSEGGAPRIIAVERRERRARLGAFGQIVEEVDEKGKTTRYEYYSASDPDGDGVAISRNGLAGDAGGYLRRIIRSDGRQTIFAYDPVGNIVAEADGQGRTTRYRVNALNQVVREEHPDGMVRTNFFDANDNLVKVETEAGGRRIVEEFHYDALDRVVLRRQQAARDQYIETRYTYDPSGLLVRVTFPEGNQVAFEYDDEGRTRCLVRGPDSPERSTECAERDEDGAVVALVDGEGAKTLFSRNGFGEVVARIDPLGNRREFERDDGGRIVAVRDLDAQGTQLALSRFSFDAEGNPIQRARLLWRDTPGTSRWVVEPWKEGEGAQRGGEGDAAADAAADQVVIEEDDLGRPLAITRGSGSERATVRYVWNGNGRLAALTDGNGNTTQFFYDALDRLAIERFPDGTERRTSYDRRDDVVQSIDRNGSVLDIERDAAGRPVVRNVRPASGVLGTLRQRFAYDGLGRLLLAVDEGDPADSGDDVVSRFVYDSLSRPVAEEMDGRWLAREYDDAGDVTALSLPTGDSFFFTFDDAGKMASIVAGGGGAVPLGEAPPDEARRLMRDSLGRLVAAEEDGQVWRYVYDAAGNMTIREDEEGQAVFTPNALNEYTGRLRYDAAGDLVSDGERDFRYDIFGRLVGIWKNGAAVARYRYDAFDRRIAKEVGGVERRASWDGFRLVGEEGGGPGISYVYAAGSGVPLAMVAGGTVRRLFADRRGSIVALAGADGRIAHRFRYDPYGRLIEGGDAAPFSFGFAGHILDRETGLLFMRHRFYDPALGRFLTPDPLGFKAQMRALGRDATAPALSYHAGQGWASRAAIPNRPLRISERYAAYPFGRIARAPARRFKEGEPNLYLYARDDPSTFADPLGLASIVFDRSEGQISLVTAEGASIGEFAAANNAVHPDASPYRQNGYGPFPNGTYSIGLPEFYSEAYRQRVVDDYELGVMEPWAYTEKAGRWRGEPQQHGDYHEAFGRIRIFVGGGGWGADDASIAGRGLFIHGGRNDYRKKTLGCIRVDDADLQLMAVQFLDQVRAGDPVTTLVVQD